MKKIILPEVLSKQFKYTYTNAPFLIFEPKKKKKSYETETYWVAEAYRIVEDNLIQYQSDYPYKEPEPKWIEASKMRQDFSRYEITITDISETTLQKIDKKQSLMLGIAPEHLACNFKGEKPKEFKKSLEVWRMAQYWKSLYETTWEDNPEVILYQFDWIKTKPKYKNYLDVHWYEKRGTKIQTLP